MVEEDRLIWNDSTHGQYNVKSGYKLLLRDTGKFNGSDQREDWLCLWKIQAPPKAKHLLWRICRSCLPTRLRLQEKHVSCPLSCPLCGHDQEDDWHIIFDCTVSCQARISAGLQQILSKYMQQGSSTKEAILAICSYESSEVAGIFALLTWSLWQNRNSMVWKEEQVQGRSIGLRVKHEWEEWRSLHQVQVGFHQMQQHIPTRWQQPSQGWYKCNVDAAFHRELNKISTGWCLRDHVGRFVMVETTWLDGNHSIIEGEALALTEAIRAIEHRRLSHVIFETDSKSVVDAIKHCRVGFSEFSLVVSYINNLLSCNPNFKVEFVKRQANMVAHTLARAAISWSSRCVFETIPICISSLLINEMA